MASVGADDDLIRPDALRRISEEKEMEKLKEATGETEEGRGGGARAPPDVHGAGGQIWRRRGATSRRWSAAPRRKGKREVMAFRFPSEWCTDKGRAINNFEPHWPETLTGFAKRGYEYYEQELRPAGYKVRAQILDFPGGVPGDVGIFLSW